VYIAYTPIGFWSTGSSYMSIKLCGSEKGIFTESFKKGRNMTITYVTAGPDVKEPFTIKNQEEVYIHKAPPPQPPIQRGSIITNLGSLRQINKQLNVACAGAYMEYNLQGDSYSSFLTLS